MIDNSMDPYFEQPEETWQIGDRNRMSERASSRFFAVETEPEALDRFAWFAFGALVGGAIISSLLSRRTRQPQTQSSSHELHDWSVLRDHNIAQEPSASQQQNLSQEPRASQEPSSSREASVALEEARPTEEVPVAPDTYIASDTDGANLDETNLLEQVRSQLGLVVSRARSIDVVVNQGTVTLSGPVLAAEADKLLDCVRNIRGVERVVNNLDVRSTTSGSTPRKGRKKVTRNVTV